MIGLSAVNATDPATTNTTSNATLNSTNNTTSDNTSTVTKQTTKVMKGYWMFSSAAAVLNPTSAAALKKEGITDVFVCTRDVNGIYHYSELKNAITQLTPYGIKVHAWIVCFKNGDSFVDPSGYYSYKVAYKYKKVKYKAKKKVMYKKWYRSHGKWKYAWRYKWKYYWAYKWLYKYKTKTGYNTSYNDQLIKAIANIDKNYAVAGIHLDYVRYSGVASAGHAAYQQQGGANAAANTITNFVAKVRKVVTKQLSAALMPEANIRSDGLLQNVYYYGQDYKALSNYLDFLVPMTYEENYNTNNTWITQMTRNIVNLTNGKPVYSGIMTYDGDDNANAVNSDLSADVQSAKDGGASGYVLFRYGIGPTVVPSW